MAQDHGLCRKKEKCHKWNGARAATAGPCCSCQRDSSRSLQTCWFDTLMILAHMDMNRAKQSRMTGRGKNVEGSGHDMAKVARQAHSLQNKTAAGKHSRWTLRPAQASKKQPADGRPRSKQQQPQTMSACLSPCSAGKWGSAVVLAAMKAGADLPTAPTPPIAFACHCPYPLP